MDGKLSINTGTCIKCGKCARVCPSQIITQEIKGAAVKVQNVENCIACGHCVAVCPTGSVLHSEFPPEKVHPFKYSDYPTPEQMMLMCKARRSNRAFSTRPIPREMLEQIIEAAHRAPTASNMQQVHFTLVTDPKLLDAISRFTLNVFNSAAKKLRNPILKPVLKRIMPDAYRYLPAFDRLNREYANGHDMILRGATAALFIHTPKSSRFGSADANLAYQNGSLMAECLGVNQFYMGFVCSAIHQENKGTLANMLGINGTIHAAMALGMPEFRFSNYIDKKDTVETDL